MEEYNIVLSDWIEQNFYGFDDGELEELLQVTPPPFPAKKKVCTCGGEEFDWPHLDSCEMYDPSVDGSGQI